MVFEVAATTSFIQEYKHTEKAIENKFKMEYTSTFH
jgi:hypothetical protein